MSDARLIHVITSAKEDLAQSHNTSINYFYDNMQNCKKYWAGLHGG